MLSDSISSGHTSSFGAVGSGIEEIQTLRKITHHNMQFVQARLLVITFLSFQEIFIGASLRFISVKI